MQNPPYIKQKYFYLGLALILIILWLLPCEVDAQSKWFSKKDIAPIALVFTAGHVKGWKDESEFHRHAFFKRFPNLNRAFWDISVQNEPGFLNTEWDFSHVAASTYKALFVTAIVLRMGEKKKWYWYLWDGFKFSLAHSLGFHTAYSLIFKNKL